MKDDIEVKYVPYVFADYVPAVGNMKDPKQIISSRYACVQLPEEYWKMYTIKLSDNVI